MRRTSLVEFSLVAIVVLLLAILAIYFLLPSEHGSLLTVSEKSCTTMTLYSNEYSGNESLSSLSGYSVEGICLRGNSSSGDALAGLAYVASTPEQQAQGLQNVPNFGNCNGNSTSAGFPCIGMIFVTGVEQNLCFWMHDTEIPLQQVWISSSGIVSDIYQAQPESDNSVCHSAQFVLETFPSAEIETGDNVSIFTED